MGHKAPKAQFSPATPQQPFSGAEDQRQLVLVRGARSRLLWSTGTRDRTESRITNGYAGKALAS